MVITWSFCAIFGLKWAENDQVKVGLVLLESASACSKTRRLDSRYAASALAVHMLYTGVVYQVVQGMYIKCTANLRKLNYADDVHTPRQGMYTTICSSDHIGHIYVAAYMVWAIKEPLYSGYVEIILEKYKKYEIVQIEYQSSTNSAHSRNM